jgi:hypothetical protein
VSTLQLFLQPFMLAKINVPFKYLQILLTYEVICHLRTQISTCYVNKYFGIHK